MSAKHWALFGVKHGSTKLDFVAGPSDNRTDFAGEVKKAKASRRHDVYCELQLWQSNAGVIASAKKLQRPEKKPQTKTQPKENNP